MHVYLHGCICRQMHSNSESMHTVIWVLISISVPMDPSNAYQKLKFEFYSVKKSVYILKLLLYI